MGLDILVLAPQPFFVQRGTPIAVRMLLSSLAAAGHSCDAIVLAGGEEVDLPGVEVIRVPAPRGLGPGFSAGKLVADALMFPAVAWRLARHRYDMIIAVEEAAFMALALKPVFGVPYIYDIDSSIPEQIRDRFALPGWLDRLIVAAERRAVRGSIGAIPCCKALGEMVQDYDADLPVQTLEDVPLTGAAASDAAAPPPGDVRFDEPVVMYIGNLEPYQGVDLLIEGFARARAGGTPARLVVIGGTPGTIAAHRDVAAAAGVADDVTFVGPRPIGEIGRYLAAATVVASPRRQGRNTPMKVYSYLASGRPLLATRLLTHTQVLDDDIAMLVEPTAEDMGRGIAALLADPALRERLARQAAARVRAEFSPDAYRRKLTGFLDRQIVPRLGLAGSPG